MGQGRVKAGACLNLLALHLSNCSLAVTDFGSTFLMEDQILQRFFKFEAANEGCHSWCFLFLNLVGTTINKQNIFCSSSILK